MSSLLYPLGLIAGLQTKAMDRTVGDDFEDGTTATRRMWAASNSKREFIIQHAQLTYAEMRWLRGFWNARSGQYDSFWLRDNVNRQGNAQVRFAEAIPETRAGGANNVSVKVQEIAPLRLLPQFGEIDAVVPTSGLVWYFDANRETYISHLGSIIQSPNAWDETGKYPAPWQGGTLAVLAGILTQWQSFGATGTNWARSAGNVAELAGAQPACTLFAIVRHSTASTKQVLLSVGATATGAALGIALSAANNYEPWIGGAEVWTGAQQSNGTADTWRSIAVVWPAASNSASLYINGALIGTVANTRSLTAGPVALQAAPDGTLKANPSGSATNSNVAHAMGWSSALTLAQVKALHNLFGYQYGLAIVP